MKVLTTPSAAGRRAERSLQRSVARAIERNRRLGLPIAVMYKGKASLVSVEKALAEVRTSSLRRRAKAISRKPTK